MKKRNLFGVALALVALLTLALPASATQSNAVSGKMEYASQPPIPEFRQAGHNCFISLDLGYHFFDGDLDGVATLHWNIVSHGPCPAGPFQYDENLKARGTFVGTVDGKEGTFDLIFVGRGWPAETGEPALTAKIVVLSGTGELANLHGLLEVSYNMGDAFDSYSGKMHFDP